MQGRSTSVLRPRPYFFILYFETGSHEVAEGLTKGRERERDRERERERERAEAGREPRSSGLHLPKYWDYKRVPPRPALRSLFIYFFFFFAVPGIEFRGVLPPRYAPGPIFYALF